MTSRRSNGAAEASVNSAIVAMQAPVLNSFVMSQRLALESAKFWARRMRAYADQMETIATCRSPDELAGAQTRFFARMREDYVAESETLGSLLKPDALSNGEDTRGEA